MCPSLRGARHERRSKTTASRTPFKIKRFVSNPENKAYKNQLDCFAPLHSARNDGKEKSFPRRRETTVQIQIPMKTDIYYTNTKSLFTMDAVSGLHRNDARHDGNEGLVMTPSSLRGGTTKQSRKRKRLDCFASLHSARNDGKDS